jgi:hypothetical protein
MRGNDLPDVSRDLTCHKDGLFEAQSGDVRDAIVIVVPPTAPLTLADLHVPARFPYIDRSPPGLIDMLDCIERWASARTSGEFMSGTRRAMAILATHHKLLEIICGSEWRTAEDAAYEVKDTADAIGILKAAVRAGPGSKDVLDDLEADMEILAQDDVATRMSTLVFPFSEIWHGMTDPAWVTGFCFRLASTPHTLRRWSGSNLGRGLQQVLRAPGQLRLACFVVHAVALMRANDPRRSQGLLW